jgi:hypothetical protein
MNPRQRRGVLFLAVAVVGAIAIFFAVVGYVNDVESQVGNRVQGYVLRGDVRAYQPLAADQLEKVEIPERWPPPSPTCPDRATGCRSSGGERTPSAPASAGSWGWGSAGPR